MLIRCCQLEEVPKVIELLEDANMRWEECDTEVILQNKIWSDFDSILVAECDDKIVGTIMTIWDPWISFIFHLCVTFEYQKKGLATMLREDAEKRLKEKGAKAVVAYVYPDNKKSLAIFRKAGYQEEGLALPLYKML